MYQAIIDKYSTPPALEQPPEAAAPDEAQGEQEPLPVQNPAKPLTSWKDSKPIMDLADYLRKNKHHGIMLVRLEGCPALHFNPGIDLSDSDRMECMHQAFELLADALPDIEFLLSTGAKIMPDHPGFC